MANKIFEQMAILMLQRDPRYPDIQRFIQENGGDPRRAFYEKAKQMGVDPDEFLKQLDPTKFLNQLR